MLNKEEIMEYVAPYFGIEPEDGKFDINDYDWQSGCYCNRRWLSPSIIVEIIQDFQNDYSCDYED